MRVRFRFKTDFSIWYLIPSIAVQKLQEGNVLVYIDFLCFGIWIDVFRKTFDKEWNDWIKEQSNKEI